MSKVIACIQTYKATRGQVTSCSEFYLHIQICSILHSHKLVLNSKRFTCNFFRPDCFYLF